MRVVETLAPVRLDSIAKAIEELAAGRAVVVVDDEKRENEGDLILAGALVTPQSMGFMVRYTSGVVCVPMPATDADRLLLPPMTAVNEDPKGTAYTVSVDARDGVSTGISAADRARTVQALARPSTTPAELTRPGHVFPLRAVEGGVLRRPGHTEAAVDLTRLAGLPPVGAIGEIVHDDGSVMRAPALRAFADAHGLTMISIADLIRYRRQHDAPVELVAVTRLPTAHGVFTAHAYRDSVDRVEHVALVMGSLGPTGGDIGGGAAGDAAAEPVLVRLHSECLTGEAFGSLRCDCGPQLDAALAAVAAAGRGVVVYLRGHEGRGVGLGHKLQAYALQDNGHDTVDANLRLGLPADARDYATGAQILVDLGVSSIALMTNNPAKRTALEDYGLRVARRVALPVASHPENLRYLRTKRDRMGHDLTGLDEERT